MDDLEHRFGVLGAAGQTGSPVEELFLDCDLGPDPAAGSGSQLVSTGTDVKSKKSSNVSTTTTKPKRVYKPRTGEAKERNKDAQRRYRERVKSKATETETTVQICTAQLQAAQEENARLRAENKVIEMICEYADVCIAALNSAAGKISTAASSITTVARTSLLTVYADLMEAFWRHLKRPSDEQLRELCRQEGDLHPLNPTFMALLYTFVNQWYSAPPESRVLPERKLSIVFECRDRFANIMLEVDEKKALRLIRAFSPVPP